MYINWKTVIIGLIITIILSAIIPKGGIFALILATIYVGYAIGGNYRNGAINGAIVGVILSIIAGILTDYISGILFEGFSFIIVFLFVIGAITYGIIGAIGGIIGIFIKKRRTSTESTDNIEQ